MEVDLCPSCQGLLLRRARLIPLLEALTKELKGRVTASQDLSPAPSGTPAIDCPSCGKRMEQNGYMGTNLVEIDSCPFCWSLWLDCEELGLMALLYARTELRGEDREREAKAREPSLPGLRRRTEVGPSVRGILAENFVDLLFS